jgi:hypothetical protein
MSDISISIDGRQHVRKLCERYLTEREMALLEWIRFSRLRNAEHITLTITQDQTLIVDNGRPISQALWQAFETLLTTVDSASIERSIECLKPLRGIGILAPLAAGSTSFALVNPGPDGPQTIVSGSGISGKTLARIEAQVALVLGPRPVDLSREREILRYHLPLVSARIVLNHEPIQPRQHSRDTFLSLKLYQGDIAVGSVSLPKSKNHSSLELCHGDIPWRTVHYPASQGRVYHTRLSTVLNEDELGGIKDQIDEASLRLLEHFRDHPESWPFAMKNRIEELLFEWSRHLAPDFPIRDLPLFSVSGGSRRLSLAELQEKSRREIVNAVITDHNQPPPGKGLLILTRKQADFLSRTAGIRLSFVGLPGKRKETLWKNCMDGVRNGWMTLDRIYSWMAARGSDGEAPMEIEKRITEQLLAHPDWDRIPDLLRYRIRLISRSGPWPSHLHARRKRITLHRKHLITRALLQAMGDKQSLSLLLKALMPPEAP